MFTGIIEEIGCISQILKTPSGAAIEISCRKVLEGLRVGDSVAVNGVCLTAAKVQKNGFTADMMPETLKSTNLGELVQGHYVNLERAVSPGGRFGGHMVLGHVDCTGKIIKKYPEGNAVAFLISVPPELSSEIIPKGSIAVDGISLTVQKVEQARGTKTNMRFASIEANKRNEVEIKQSPGPVYLTAFKVSLIPHTLKSTVLNYKGPGDTVNIETDILGKYVIKFLTGTRSSDDTGNDNSGKGLTEDVLRSWGF
ncbi:riboflavin synthase [Biomaibacter acetigenes]|jgi:riboflavin synthase|uniref:Riboflavin synthase n=1 Tax=Biomaibacter acetigenes TaxID=2316383 RepID=A0A3G2R810_9FIRM|nr:riboflavin synthase [Biomaibacter acetigenes]AYO31576.1 riboflavin synthase [Biomaibacter acetigenes]RKL62094.1 riboflavin synthase [Thermoanaerobacteraceae bacterium SP2]